MPTPLQPQDPTRPDGPPPADPQSPPEDERRRTFTAQLRAMVLCSVLGLTGTAMATATPAGIWAMIGAALALLAAVVFSLLALVTSRRLRVGGAATLMLWLLLAGNVYFLFNAGANAVMWNVTAPYRECLDTALTQRSQDSCPGVLEDSIMQWMPGGSGH